MAKFSFLFRADFVDIDVEADSYEEAEDQAWALVQQGETEELIWDMVEVQALDDEAERMIYGDDEWDGYVFEEEEEED